jgi:hypothetical protein
VSKRAARSGDDQDRSSKPVRDQRDARLVPHQAMFARSTMRRIVTSLLRVRLSVRWSIPVRYRRFGDFGSVVRNRCIQPLRCVIPPENLAKRKVNWPQATRQHLEGVLLTDRGNPPRLIAAIERTS